MKRLWILRSVCACLIATFLSISYTHQLDNRTQHGARELERNNKKFSSNNSLPETYAKSNRTIVIKTAHSSRKILLNNTENQEQKFNATENTDIQGCRGDESPAICHTYIHNMYQFYSTVIQNSL